MCLICIELDRGKMKPYEARMAYVESRATMDPDHAGEVLIKIQQAESEESEPVP